MFGASASVTTRSDISMGLGVVLCHPTADYLKEYPGDPNVEMPEFRTSLALGLDINVVNLSITLSQRIGNSLNLGLGLSSISIGESIPFGISVLRPYSGIGMVASLGYSFNPRMSLDLRYRYLLSRYTGTKTKFLCHEMEVSPSVAISTGRIFNLRLSLPLTASVKADAVSFRASVALSVQMNSMYFKEGGR